MINIEDCKQHPNTDNNKENEEKKEKEKTLDKTERWWVIVNNFIPLTLTHRSLLNNTPMTRYFLHLCYWLKATHPNEGIHFLVHLALTMFVCIIQKEKIHISTHFVTFFLSEKEAKKNWIKESTFRWFYVGTRWKIHQMDAWKYY